MKIAFKTPLRTDPIFVPRSQDPVFNSLMTPEQKPDQLQGQHFHHPRVRGAHAQDMGGMQMAANARTLFDDEAVNNVVAYIGTLNPAKPADRGRGDAEQGRSLYSLCSSCHGQSAEGITLQKAPRLNSQHAWYLTKQLGNFKAGVRGSHQDDVEGKIMNAITQALADEEAINNIVAYIQSLE